MMSVCVKVPRREGENIRKKLSEAGLLNSGLKPKLEGEDLYIPVSRIPEGMPYPVGETDFEEVARPGSYREYLDLPPDLEALLPVSFDIVGDIYIVKLEDALLPHAGDVANALLEANRNARVVALDRGVRGEFRTRNLEILAGEERTVTTHREYGLEYSLDLASVYFSPRLATERKRIADLAAPGERILDMFCGAGPFSLMLARTGKPDIIYAVDKNPAAINYLILNIKRNKIKHVAPMLGDAREVVPQLPTPDRIIMNLPHSTLEFLDTAMNAIAPEGWLHLYTIRGPEAVAEAEDVVMRASLDAGKRAEVKNIREVHNYSPARKLYCLDVRVTVGR